MFGLQGCKGSENDVQSVNEIYIQNESQNIAIQNENFDSESQNNYINEDKTELQNEDSKIPETSDPDIDTTINVDYLKTDTVLDSKQQLELLAVNFDKWNEDMDGFNNKYTVMAVAYLNRNGRLEIIVSNI